MEGPVDRNGAEPFTFLRFPKIMDLYSDPFERAQHEVINYTQWRLDRTYLLVPAQVFVGKFLASFKDYLPRSKLASFSIDQVLEGLQRNQGGENCFCADKITRKGILCLAALS